MSKHYIKVLLRSIAANKFYTFVNITGLSIGMAAGLILLLYVQFELGFDDFHENKGHIYRIITIGNESQQQSAMSPFKLTPALLESFPDIENVCRTRHMTYAVKKGDNFIMENGFLQADSSFFDIFSFTIIYGNASNALKGDNSVVLTKSAAEKYFPGENPLGKTMEISLNGRSYHQQVTAVIEDFPANSHIQAYIILPIYTTIWSYENINRSRVLPSFESWYINSFYTYILSNENFNKDQFLDKLSSFIKSRISEDFPSTFNIQPLEDIHLRSELLTADVQNKGKRNHIILFGTIAILILVIAIINYIILSTTRSLKRVKEIGLRKVIGASRMNIIKLVLGESLFISFVSLPFAIILAHLTLPYLNELLGKDISFSISSNPLILWCLILTCLLTGIVSGSYIAIYLSSFKPIDIFRSHINLGLRGSVFQKSLISLQLIIFIGLVICAGIIYQQVLYMKDNDVLGFEKENLISIYTHDAREGFNDQYLSFKSELLKNPNILYVSSSNANPPSFNTVTSYFALRMKDMNGKIVEHWVSGSGSIPEMEKDIRELLIYERNNIDFDYIEALGLQLVDGRSFDKKISSDRKAVIVNEEFIRSFNVQNPLAEKFKFGSSSINIIGIVRDYHSKSLSEKVLPVMYRMSHAFNKRYLRQVIVKTDGQNTDRVISFLEEKWKDFCPEAPFIYLFTDTYINQMYRSEINLAKLLGVFGLLAIIIASLGLFGLSLFIAQRKTREIVIRKTMGAGVGDIVIGLLKQFLVITIIANIITMPLAYYYMGMWLQNFEYQSRIDFRIFLFAGISSIILCLLTVSYHSVKTALINPVEALKYE
jgi:putative ABC transport system permease protein